MYFNIIFGKLRYSIITPAIKYHKVVIPRLDRGIQTDLDTPIKSEYDMFLLFNCRGNNF